MATVNISTTSSNTLVTTTVSSGTTLDFIINNPSPATSYFTLETIPNSSSLYDASSPKNTSGSFTLDSGQYSLIQSDYIASVIVDPGNTTLTFEPAADIPANTLRLRGVGYGPQETISI
jgi:hypothetical protein